MFIKDSGVCVYVHRLGDKVIYVGKGVSSRPFERTRRNDAWVSMVNQHGGFDVEILAWFDSDAEARLHEAKMIRDLLPACNLMMNGWTRSDEFKSRVSAAHKGKTVSTDTRNKIAQSLSDRSAAAETKQVPWNKGSKTPDVNRARSKAIRDVGTGIRYKSISAAGRALEIPKATLFGFFRGKAAHAHGRTFEYCSG